MSQNYFSGDPVAYGCLYHDGGSGLWSDYDNVFNAINTASVFTHGGSGGVIVDGIYMNNSGTPKLHVLFDARHCNFSHHTFIFEWCYFPIGVCFPTNIVKCCPL